MVTLHMIFFSVTALGTGSGGHGSVVQAGPVAIY